MEKAIKIVQTKYNKAPTRVKLVSTDKESIKRNRTQITGEG